MYPILAALLLAATPDAGPLAATPPAAERGEVRTGPPLAQTFELAHRGPAGTVTIIGVETACGCLKPTVSREVLKPGERAELAFAVNTLTQPAGPNSWRVVVRYRLDGVGPFELPVTVTATLVREVSVTPPVVAFSTAGTAAQTVTLTDRRAAPLTVVSATTTSPHLTAALRPAAPVDGVRTQAVELAVGPGFQAGEFNEELVLLTTDPACRELRVPVKVTKRTAADVAVSPDAPEVRFARGQAEASAVFQVRRPGGGAVRIERVECSNPAVRAKWPTEAEPVATVRVIVDAAKAGGQSGRAELKVVLAEPAGKEVVVPVSWSFP